MYLDVMMGVTEYVHKSKLLNLHGHKGEVIRTLDPRSANTSRPSVLYSRGVACRAVAFITTYWNTHAHLQEIRRRRKRVR